MRLNPLAILVGVCGAVIFAWILYLVVVACAFGGLEKSGQFGDMFGGFSALMSALGFAAVVTTLYLQTRQLEEERKTREETDLRQERQLEVMQQQLAAVLDQQAREREQYDSSLDPHFSFNVQVYGPEGVATHYWIQMSGASIAKLRLDGARCILGDPYQLETGHASSMRIEPPVQKGEVISFTFSYITTKNGKNRLQKFIVEYGRVPRRALAGE